MGRAQDLLEKAMSNLKDLSNKSDISERCNDCHIYTSDAAQSLI